ncbi:MAG: hemerythrin domain-containing protein [Deltaproteobacteria bacterium]|nr:hemerythrin domain-containing protein [Deltaproteobacteria bacterium]
MQELIKQLKAEHAIALDMLVKVKDAGALSREVQKTLVSFRDILIAHLNNEEVNLYPSLKRIAAEDKDLLETIDYFVKDMGVVAGSALQFFDKYCADGSSLEFGKDFSMFFAALKARIEKEEEILYAIGSDESLNLGDLFSLDRFDNSGMGLIVTGLDKKVSFMNAFAKSLLGLSSGAAADAPGVYEAAVEGGSYTPSRFFLKEGPP